MQIIGRIREAFRQAHEKSLRRKQDRELFLGAMTNGAWSIVKELTEKYPEAVRWRDEDGMTALHFAAQYGNAKTVHFLLNHGADIETNNHKGMRPLHCAAECTLTDPAAAMQALLGRGAQIEARNYSGTTPLLRAVLRKNPAAVKALVAAGADDQAANNTGYTASRLAAGMKGAGINGAVWQAIKDGRTERENHIRDERRTVEEEMQQAATREPAKLQGPAAKAV
jgi:ankyrin repeat protein